MVSYMQGRFSTMEPHLQVLQMHVSSFFWGGRHPLCGTFRPEGHSLGLRMWEW